MLKIMPFRCEIANIKTLAFNVGSTVPGKARGASCHQGWQCSPCAATSWSGPASRRRGERPGMGEGPVTRGGSDCCSIVWLKCRQTVGSPGARFPDPQAKPRPPRWRGWEVLGTRPRGEKGLATKPLAGRQGQAAKLSTFHSHWPAMGRPSLILTRLKPPRQAGCYKLTWELVRLDCRWCDLSAVTFRYFILQAC